MNNKKLILGISAIIVVAAILIVSEKLTSISPPEHRTRFFPNIEERHITAIVIREGDEAIRIEKGGVWQVAKVSASEARKSIASAADAAKQADGMSFQDAVNKSVKDSAGTSADTGNTASAPASGPDVRPADASLVQIAVERIVSLKKGDLISGNPEKQSTFGVDSASLSSIEIYVNNKSEPAGVLKIGKNGPDWSSNYVRLDGSDEVYLISGGLRQALLFDIEQWRKKPDPEPAPEPADSGDGEEEL